MTSDYKSRFVPGISFFILTLLLLSGCASDKEDDSFKGIPLKVKLPANVSTEAIKDMSLYVFDDKDLLLDILPIKNTESILLNYPGVPNLHCIAWCNIQDGTMSVSPLKKGDPLSDGFISLKPSSPTRAEMSIFTSPTDLFYGEFNVDNTSTSGRIEEQNLTVKRMVASMNITVRGLEVLSGSNDGNYSLVVRETASSIDFEGHYGGNLASYAFASGFEPGKDYVIPPFNLFPTIDGGGVTIDIYHNGDLLRSVSTDSSREPIIPIVNKTLNVLLNFKLDVSVEIAVTGWGEEYIWKEYN